MKPYLSIDLETTGLDENTCQILEIGAVIDDLVTPVDQLPVFHRRIENKPIIGEAFALSMHPKLLRSIATEDTVVLAEALLELAGFATDNGLDKKHLLVAGKNFGSFDLQFLKKSKIWGQFIKCKHRFLDPAMLYWLPTDDEPPNMETCLQRAGFPGNVTHQAVDDAKDVIRLIRFKAGIA